jgi:hypothetical protein
MLDDRGIDVQIPAGVKEFPILHNIITGSGAHPTSYPMGTGGTIPGTEVAGAWSWSLTSIYSQGQERRSYTSTPPCVFMA